MLKKGVTGKYAVFVIWDLDRTCSGRILTKTPFAGIGCPGSRDGKTSVFVYLAHDARLIPSVIWIILNYA
jgi:hypothetical protein